jgi:hypothetical protein
MSACFLALGWAVVLLAGPLSTALAEGPQENPDGKLALLIACAIEPKEIEFSAWNDQVLMHQALRRRGFKADEILTLSGPFNSQMLKNFLADAGRRVRDWRGGTVFLAYSGHGEHRAQDGRPRPYLRLPKDELVPWEDVFKALPLPRGVRLILVPDG